MRKLTTSCQYIWSRLTSISYAWISLAMEFVASLDEEISSAEYYDPDGRFIQAGTAELVLRDVLNLEALSNWRTFCKCFDIRKEDYIEAFDGRPKSLKSRKQGTLDEHALEYMNKEARYYYRAGQIATNLRNNLAIWTFIEPIVSFGIVDSILVSIGLKKTGVFHRYRDYYVWSRWEKVLFLPLVPSSSNERCQSRLLLSNRKSLSLRIISSGGAGGGAGGNGDNTSSEMMIGEEEDTSGGTSSRPFHSDKQRFLFPCSLSGLIQRIRNLLGWEARESYLNFDPDVEETLLKRFIHDMIGILLFGNLYKSVEASIKQRTFQEIPFRIMDGMIEWVNYVLQASFPLTLIFFYYLVFACY